MIMYHLNHAVKVDKYRIVIILPPDVDVLVCVIYNYSQLLYFGIDEPWFTSGKKNSRKIFPIYEVDKIELDILPVLHAQNGCDSTCKVSIKAAALKTTIEGGCELLHGFQQSKLTDDMNYIFFHLKFTYHQ